MEQPREPRLYRNEQQRFSISSETEKTLQSIDSTLKRIEKLIIQNQSQFFSLDGQALFQDREQNAVLQHDVLQR